MSFCNAPVMCHDFDALNPALAFPETLDDVHSLPESSCANPPSDSFVDECRKGFTLQSDAYNVILQHYMVLGPDLDYDACEEPWFSNWIDDDARTQGPKTCFQPTPDRASGNVLYQSDSLACPILVFDDSPACLSNGASSKDSPSQPSDGREEYNYSVPTHVLSLEPIQLTKSWSKTTLPLPKKSKKEKKKRVNGPVHCPLCNIKFDRPCHLRAHMHEHPGRFQCETCAQTFIEAHSLATHRKSHEWAPTPCPTCRKVFPKKSSYKVHLKLHDNRQRVKCPHPGCDNDFSQQGGLNRHMKTHDPQYERPKCDDCSMVFNRADIRKRHREKACRGARDQFAAQAQSPRTPLAAQPAPQQTYPTEKSLQAQAQLSIAEQYISRDLKHPSIPWVDPDYPWTGAFVPDATQVDHQPLPQDDLHQLEPVPLDAKMTMSFKFMEGRFLGQGFDQQVDMATDVDMDMGWGWRWSSSSFLGVEA